MIEPLRDDVLETGLQVEPECGGLTHPVQVDDAVVGKSAVPDQEKKNKQGDG